MDKNTQDRGQSFDRVESRIELLEKQLMEKDEELKKLLNVSKDKDEKIAKLQEGVDGEKRDTFVPVFKEASEEQECPCGDDEPESHIDDSDMPEVLKKQIKVIEKREQMVKEMLDVLEDAFDVLKQRNEALNKKEETLNREYLKLLEIESMYKGTDKLADSLGSVLPSFGLNEQKDKNTEAATEENIEE